MRENRKTKDAASKTIFQNKVLCAQFLNNFVDVPLLVDVKPEDIENVSERFVHLFTTERDADSVVKVHTPGRGNEVIMCYVISLIEHKSTVDYNVTMQILRYMVYIWEDYEKEMERKDKGVSKLVSFRYPPIIPIVFYEGKDAWTAPRQFRGRIAGGELLGKYVPDFAYYLVPPQDYSNEELLEKGDEISLIMLIEKMQRPEDLHKFLTIPPERLQEMVKNTPEYIMQIIRDILLAYLLHLKLPYDEAEEIASRVKEKEMGVLFASMPYYDIEEERRKTEEQKRKTEEERHKTEEQRRKTEEQKRKTEEAIRQIIEMAQDFGQTKSYATNRLVNNLKLSEEAAAEKVALYWKEES